MCLAPKAKGSRRRIPLIAQSTELLREYLAARPRVDDAERIVELKQSLLERVREADESEASTESRDLLDARWILNAYLEGRARPSREPAVAKRDDY